MLQLGCLFAVGALEDYFAISDCQLVVECVNFHKTPHHSQGYDAVGNWVFTFACGLVLSLVGFHSSSFLLSLSGEHNAWNRNSSSFQQK